MRFVVGIIVGVLITVGAAYVHDSMATSPGSDSAGRRVVNWDVVNQNLHDLGANLNAEWRWLTDQLHAKT